MIIGLVIKFKVSYSLYVKIILSSLMHLIQYNSAMGKTKYQVRKLYLVIQRTTTQPENLVVRLSLVTSWLCYDSRI